jgi:hypothetical protein
MSSDFNKKVFLRSKKSNNFYIAIIIIGAVGFPIMIMLDAPAETMLIPIDLVIIMLATKNKPLLQFH